MKSCLHRSIPDGLGGSTVWQSAILKSVISSVLYAGGDAACAHELRHWLEVRPSIRWPQPSVRVRASLTPCTCLLWRQLVDSLKLPSNPLDEIMSTLVR